MEEVNGKIPYVMRHNIYTMNPFEPFRIWRQHKQFFTHDTGTRHRVKHYGTVWIVSLLMFASVILIWVFSRG